MTQHISIRVPWHDNGWNGTVCNKPSENISCLKLNNISENKNDEIENSICGQCLKDHTYIPCINEGSAFMNSSEITRISTHPYKERYYDNKYYLYKKTFENYKDFQDVEIYYPPYSLPCRPYSWTMKSKIEEKSKYYDIDYNENIETNTISKTWIQTKYNQNEIFKTFYKNIIPNESLCIIYAKQIPYTDEPRRVIIGIGEILKLTGVKEYKSESHPELNSLTWETMISHSIREDNNNGFIIPYKEIYEKTKDDKDFDYNSIVVFAPQESFNEFSYAAEHVSYDSVIEVILKCIKTYKTISSILKKDYSNVINWLEKKLDMVLEQRGEYPGFSSMLYALGIKRGAYPLGEEIIKNAEQRDENLWDYFEKIMNNPKEYLDEKFSKNIEEKDQKTWKDVLTVEQKELFKLLSRFSLNTLQADTIFNEEKRTEILKNNSIKGDFSTQAIINNPYILYEKTRLINSICISIKKVDFAMYLIPSLKKDYIIKTQSSMSGENDKRRIRALLVSLLENEAQNGNTILPINKLMELLNEYNENTDSIVKIKTELNRNNLLSYNDFFSEEVVTNELEDTTIYYKLARLQEFERIIEKNIDKRLKATSLELENDWEIIVNEFFDKNENEEENENDKLKELEARNEKIDALKKMSKSRIFTLTGGAGTGKTTVLSIFCSVPEIKDNGVLLLAPTGKAAVRFKESMGDNAINFETYNIAQFLSKSGRFNFESMRYILSDKDADVPETVIIDESSMLTEEMFGALMQAIKTSRRIIFVGDSNQLPPIGAGKPFVDLINLLEEKYPENFKKLIVNRRQKGMSNMLDVEFSNIFTDKSEIRENIISDIINSEQNRIKFEKWDNKEDLEKKIIKFLVNELELKDADDSCGFNESLGAVTYDNEYNYFNLGCSKNVENWQILAPVRNMPQGVVSINKLIHEKYRANYIELSEKYGKYKKICKSLGPEKIVYGDKVINVINKSRYGYNSNNNKNEKLYVANGEIGIAGLHFGNKFGDFTKKLHVEFSSQIGIDYDFDPSEFSDEHDAVLELAYALTVHKAQGSQFKKVLLVLDKDSRMVSKEMLYTALTRQIEKIIILYNDEPYKLLYYSTDDNSNIAQRLTDLFSEIKEKRPSVIIYNNKYYDENKIHKTLKGELVRSKSEVIIANMLYNYEKEGDFKYYYEKELILKDNIVRFPDFTIKTDLGDTWYWEHCGMMSDINYKNYWEEKKKIYEENGIVEGKNLIVTYDDEKGGIDTIKIEELINSYLI